MTGKVGIQMYLKRFIDEKKNIYIYVYLYINMYTSIYIYICIYLNDVIYLHVLNQRVQLF
jgi:hypothetical protein